jgi:hypothetical protein
MINAVITPIRSKSRKEIPGKINIIHRYASESKARRNTMRKPVSFLGVYERMKKEAAIPAVPTIG